MSVISQDFSLALRTVLRQRRRSFVAIFAVAFGITALILASGFIDWNLRFGRESTIHSQIGHVRIFKAGYRESGSANPFAFLLPDDPSRRGIIESVPQVRAIAPRLAFNGLISHGDSTISFIGEGVDPLPEQLLSRSLTIVEGSALSIERPKGIIVGQGLAANLGVKSGDNVVLIVNRPGGAVNAVDAQVLGLFATITKAYDDAALRVPIAMARELMRVSGSHSYAVVLDRTESTDNVVAELRDRFRDEAVEIVPWYDLADFYKKTAELFRKQVSVLRLIIAVIIILSISNSMMMSVLERTSEIGTSMALGIKRRGVLRMFLYEGVLIGAMGGALGLAVGFASSQLISAVGIPMPAPPGMAFGYRAGIMVSWPLAFEAIVLAMITTLAATLYPAWRASRMNIVDALRQSR